MELDFFVQNWYLFLALGVIVALLFMDTVRNRISGIQSVTVTRLPQLINHEDAVVIDVCESAEYRNGHIPGAINIPVSQLEDSVTKLAKYKKKGVPLVVACQSGNRSARAAAKLRKLEFDNVYALTGGLVAWQKENLPVEK
ncbi:MAG: rhodanese-like domain-containing protein [marine bacterium B5-7]|nr:MAG: rhodanese-like domain-containing protein [marine bacterium B5-7]